MNGQDEYPGVRARLEERAELMRIAAASCLDRKGLDPHTKAWAQRMAATKPLRRPMPAEHIAAWLGVESTQAYADLVRLYDAGLVRINTGHGGADARTREAMDEATT